MLQFLTAKKWRLLVALLTLFAAAFWYFFPKSQNDPFGAYSWQTGLVLDFNNLHDVSRLIENHPDPALKAALQTSVLQTCLQDAALAERLFRPEKALQALFSNGRWMLGLTLNTADSLHGLWVGNINQSIDLQYIVEKDTLVSKVSPASFRGQTLYTIHVAGHGRLVVAQVRNLFLFSRHSYLLEDGILQLESRAGVWAGRQATLDTQAPLKVYLRPEALLAPLQLAEAWKTLPDLLRKNARWIGWAWDGQNCRGAVETTGWLGSMREWGRVSRDAVWAVLPDNTAFLAWAGFDNRPLFYKGLLSGQQTDFETYIAPWAGNEAAFVLTEPFSKNMQEEQFLVLKAHDTRKATDLLRLYGEQQGLLQRYEYQTFEVLQFLNQSALAPLSGEGRELFRNPACALLGRYVVFANSTAALELWIDKFIVNQTLATDLDFLQQQKRLQNPAQALLWVNARYTQALLNNLLQPAAPTVPAGDAQALSRLGLLALEIQANGANNRLDLSVVRQPAAAVSGTSILWKTTLAAEVITAPSVLERWEKGERKMDILVQDEHYLLYCLDEGGKIRWHRQMNEPLLSNIQMVDFQEDENGNCYLFNTAGHIWLLNATGENVSGFPLKLKSPAVNGLSSVDFDQDRKYCFFIACANGNVYGYDRFGRPLQGWNPQTDLGLVPFPVLHFRKDEKDFLAMLSRDGKLSVFGRNGAARFSPLHFSGQFASPPQADAAAGRIACGNTDGKVFVSNLEGRSFVLQLGDPAQVSPAHLAFLPLGNGDRSAFVVAHGGLLQAESEVGKALKPLFSNRLPVFADTLFAAGAGLGFVNREKKQIFMTDARGQVSPDFPLAGTTPFVVVQLSSFRPQKALITGNLNQVYAYQLR